VQSLPALLLGLAVRLWAAGYIGKAGRVSIPGGETRIVSWPYRLLRHPLYMGNALLVAGMLWAYRPWLVVGVVVMLLFFVEYGFIIAAEEKALAGVPADRDARFGFRRAMTESRTWVAVSAAYALAWFKLALVYGFAVN
jgi:protein-S-isoprenylcysteine O-methyltransferase Ste14